MKLCFAKDQIANAVKAQLLPADYDWREALGPSDVSPSCQNLMACELRCQEDPRLTDFTEPINLSFDASWMHWMQWMHWMHLSFFCLRIIPAPVETCGIL